MEWNLAKGKVRQGGALVYEGVANYRQRTADQKGMIVMGLTDHNHEYLKTTVVTRPLVQELILSSRYTLGKLGSVSGIASADTTGKSEVSMSHDISDEKPTMTTKIGIGPDAKKFLELQREQRISKTQSMVVSLRINDRRETSIVYQYRAVLP